MPKVSVIIPVFNNSATLAETLESALAQTFTDYEIITIDDGSTDNSKDIILKYAKQHPGKIHYIHQKNSGPAEARNKGIQNAQGEYIAFLDADDLWMPNKLKIQTAVMDETPELGFTFTETIVIDSLGNQTSHWKQDDRPQTFNCLFQRNFISNLTVMVRRSCFNTVGLLDPTLTYSQDYDLWLKLAKKFSFKGIALPLAQYRIHTNNISHNIAGTLNDILTIIKKPEISGDLSAFTVIRRRADTYIHFTDTYLKKGYYYHTGLCYLKSCWHLPFIGYYYWPKETTGKRFTILYRILRIYVLGIFYLIKGIVQRKPS
jgi:glycosyltransferase involved in cell wall biosynthesis